jgi:hypothetical protein
LTGLETKDVSKKAPKAQRGWCEMSGETIGWIGANIIALILFGTGLYLIGRIKIPELAEKEKFFSSPKLGRIKARKRGNRIIGFFDNLVGKGKHVNPITGIVEPREILDRGFWWKHFGAVFIWLDDIHEYEIAKEAVEGDNGELVYTTDTAHSIFVDNILPLTAKLLTADGILLLFRLQIISETVDGSKALSLPVSWTIPEFKAVYATARDFVGARKVVDLITSQNEGGTIKIYGKEIFNSGFVPLMLNLNNSIPGEGNVSLRDTCGQKIVAVNVVDIDFVNPAEKEAFSTPIIANREAQRKVEDAKAERDAMVAIAEGEKTSAHNKAEAIRKVGAAEASVLKKKAKAIGPGASNVLTAEAISKMTGLKVLGGNTMVGLNEERTSVGGTQP